MDFSLLEIVDKEKVNSSNVAVVRFHEVLTLPVKNRNPEANLKVLEPLFILSGNQEIRLEAVAVNYKSFDCNCLDYYHYELGGLGMDNVRFSLCA